MRKSMQGESDLGGLQWAYAPEELSSKIFATHEFNQPQD
jgi:hypothetical protein